MHTKARNKAHKRIGQWLLLKRFFLRRKGVLLKLGILTVILIGMESIIFYLTSVDSQNLETILYIFMLSVVALLVAILPQISEKTRR